MDEKSQADTVAQTQGVTEEDIIDQLRTCYDPEIPLNIFDLGLVYDIVIGEAGQVRIDMTLTSPNCPSIEELPLEVEEKVRDVEGVTSAEVNLVWDPPFHISMMSEEAKLELGLL